MSANVVAIASRHRVAYDNDPLSSRVAAFGVIPGSVLMSSSNGSGRFAANASRAVVKAAATTKQPAELVLGIQRYCPTSLKAQMSAVKNSIVKGGIISQFFPFAVCDYSHTRHLRSFRTFSALFETFASCHSRHRGRYHSVGLILLLAGNSGKSLLQLSSSAKKAAIAASSKTPADLARSRVNETSTRYRPTNCSQSLNGLGNGDCHRCTS